ncbi:MAG TPA: hypothetical protein VNN80_30235 [Polyangiaceae bacterium]|nr:hypothetical protein [Polyangiaceae bacterium]
MARSRATVLRTARQHHGPLRHTDADLPAVELGVLDEHLADRLLQLFV